jgi:hypothetical protein
VAEDGTRAEVEQRLGRPFDKVQDQLEEYFDLPWDEVAVVIETSVEKTKRSRAEVIVDLVGRTDEKPAVHESVRRAVVRWIGKPWREREDPWQKFKDRVPEMPAPPPTDAEDLREWSPMQREEDDDERA